MRLFIVYAYYDQEQRNRARKHGIGYEKNVVCVCVVGEKGRMMHYADGLYSL